MSFAIHPFHNAKHGLQLILPVLWSQSFWTSLSLLNWMPMNLTGCNKPYITSLITNCPMTAWTSLQVFLWFPSLHHPPSTLNPKPNPTSTTYPAQKPPTDLKVLCYRPDFVFICGVLHVLDPNKTCCHYWLSDVSFYPQVTKELTRRGCGVFVIHPFRLQIVKLRLILPAFSIQLFLMHLSLLNWMPRKLQGSN